MTPEQKIKFLDRSKAHFEADMLRKDTYGEFSGRFKGCSIGCHFHDIRSEISK